MLDSSGHPYFNDHTVRIWKKAAIQKDFPSNIYVVVMICSSFISNAMLLPEVQKKDLK